MLSNPLRLRILQQLAENEKLLVNTLALALDVRPSVVSHHLKLMESYGLVKRRPAGKYAFYEIDIQACHAAGRFTEAAELLEGLA